MASNDEGQKSDEPIGHVGEGLGLAAVVGHLQKWAKILQGQIINLC